MPSAMNETTKLALMTDASSAYRSTNVAISGTSRRGAGVELVFGDDFHRPFHRVVGRPAVLVTEQAVLLGAVHFDRERRDLARNRHGVGVRAHDFEAVNHVCRGHVEGHRAVSRD